MHVTLWCIAAAKDGNHADPPFTKAFRLVWTSISLNVPQVYRPFSKPLGAFQEGVLTIAATTIPSPIAATALSPRSSD